jgi:FixJ family two-component response regulator
MSPNRFHEEGLRFLQHQLDSLSSVERQVLEGILSGRSNEALSEQLGLSAGCVADHTARLVEMFGAVDVNDLVHKASLAR